MRDLVVIDGDSNNSVSAKQFFEQLKSRKHHAAPLVVTRQIFAVYGLTQPLSHHGRIDAVIEYPLFVPSIVGRIDTDAFDLAMKSGQ